MRRRLRVEARVGFVAKQVFRLQGDGPRNGGTLHHTATDLRGIEVAGMTDLHSLEAAEGAALALAGRLAREHVEREEHILEHRHAVKQRRALKQHARLAAQVLQLRLVHRQQIAPVVEHAPALRLHQPDDTLHRHRLARAASSDDEVRLARLEDGADVVQDHAPVERLDQMFYFDHFVSMI